MRALVLTGSDKAFAAGADIKEVCLMDNTASINNAQDFRFRILLRTATSHVVASCAHDDLVVTTDVGYGLL